MKRIISILLTAFLLFSMSPILSAAASAADTAPAQLSLAAYTSEELLQMHAQIRGLLHSDGTYPFSELQKSNTGYEVIALQTRLTALGYYKKEIVENFGNGTYNAVRDFEKANGLAVNGVASIADQQALYAGAAIGSDGKTVADTAQSDETFSAYTSEELLDLWYRIGDMLRADGSYPFVELQKGNVGYEVMALQTRLQELGYYDKEVVDTFGNGTYNALRDFERQNELTVNGVASVADQQTLFSDAAKAYVKQATTTTTKTNSNDATSGATQ